MKGTCKLRISLPGANYVSIVYMTISVLYLVYPKQYCALVLPSPAMEKMILSICELEITSVLRSSASVVAVT